MKAPMWMIAVVLAVQPGRASAQDSYEFASGLVRWFTDLNRSWDKVVVEQERAQLLRAVDRLRRGLYALESDSRILVNDIPDGKPDAAQTAALKSSVEALQTSLDEVNVLARSIGADLRLHGGAVAEEKRARAGVSRSFAIKATRRQLDDPEHWDANFVRNRLKAGIKQLESAQLAVTEFRQKLAAQR